jgi:hypothetical protein
MDFCLWTLSGPSLHGPRMNFGGAMLNGKTFEVILVIIKIVILTIEILILGH